MGHSQETPRRLHRSQALPWVGPLHFAWSQLRDHQSYLFGSTWDTRDGSSSLGDGLKDIISPLTLYIGPAAWVANWSLLVAFDL